MHPSIVLVPSLLRLHAIIHLHLPHVVSLVIRTGTTTPLMWKGIRVNWDRIMGRLMHPKSVGNADSVSKPLTCESLHLQNTCLIPRIPGTIFKLCSGSWVLANISLWAAKHCLRHTRGLHRCLQCKIAVGGREADAWCGKQTMPSHDFCLAPTLYSHALRIKVKALT